MSEDEKELACENCGRTHFGETPCVTRMSGLLRCSPCASSYHDGIADSIEGILVTTDMDRLIKLRSMVERRIRDLTPTAANRFAVRSIPPDKKIQAIKSIRWYTGLDLKGAYDLVGSCPFEFTSIRNASGCAKELRDLGCVIEEVR